MLIFEKFLLDGTLLKPPATQTLGMSLEQLLFYKQYTQLCPLVLQRIFFVTR